MRQGAPWKKFEALDLFLCEFKPSKPSIEEALTLKMKPLSSHLSAPWKKFEALDLFLCEFKPSKPSIEEALTLKMKPLSSHLKYAYLRESTTLPVIMFA